MGSWNVKCLISRTNIRKGDKIAVILLDEIEITRLKSLPIYCVYNDSGSVVNIRNTDYTFLLENYYGIDIETIIGNKLGTYDSDHRDYISSLNPNNRITGSYFFVHEEVYNNFCALGNVEFLEKRFIDLGKKMIDELEYNLLHTFGFTTTLYFLIKTLNKTDQANLIFETFSFIENNYIRSEIFKIVNFKRLCGMANIDIKPYYNDNHQSAQPDIYKGLNSIISNFLIRY
jgi:hypothetical protein